MKKLTFIGLLALSFQQMVLAQSNYTGITVGNNTWMNTTNNGSSYSPEFSNSGPQLGLFRSIYLSNSFLLRVEAQYSYLISKNRKDQPIDTTRWLVDEFFHTSNYHQFRLPVRLVFVKGRIQPSIGFVYSRSKASRTMEGDVNHNIKTTGESKKWAVLWPSLSASIGFDYTLSSKLSLNVNYALGTSWAFYRKKGDPKAVKNVFAQGNLHQVNVSLSYRLGKNWDLLEKR